MYGWARSSLEASMSTEMDRLCREVNAALEEEEAKTIRWVTWIRRAVIAAIAINLVVLAGWFYRGGRWHWWTALDLILLFVTVVYLFFSRRYVERIATRAARRRREWEIDT